MGQKIIISFLVIISIPWHELKGIKGHDRWEIEENLSRHLLATLKEPCSCNHTKLILFIWM